METLGRRRAEFQSCIVFLISSRSTDTTIAVEQHAHNTIPPMLMSLTQNISASFKWV